MTHMKGIKPFKLRPEVGYHIRHEKEEGKLDNYWEVYYEDKLIGSYRYKSRSKFEMQGLLDHMNKRVQILTSECHKLSKKVYEYESITY